MQQTKNTADVDIFKLTLEKYKTQIDADLEAYSATLISQTEKEFGTHSAEAMRVFCDVLSRGGKRIRGALTMLSYDMYGGSDSRVRIEAARIMEIIQTYLLVVDDVHDRSKTRRGKPTAHILLGDLHESSNWKDGSYHFGESIAISAALIGNHITMSLAASLNVEPKILIKAIKLLNDNLRTTGEGQVNDMFNNVTQTSSVSEIENVLLWKTAYYTFTNPLQFGAVLAGATSKDLEHISQYSLNAGRAFQISDDILGVFGDEFESGKSPIDDIREGKRTLLTYHASQLAEKEDGYFLESVLGKHDLTQSEFLKCKEIILRSGALDIANAEALRSVDEAIDCVEKFWSKDFPEQALFLSGLVKYLLVRQS